MRVTGFEPVAKEHKPRGVGKIRPTTPETDYGPVPAALVPNSQSRSLESFTAKTTFSIPHWTGSSWSG